MNAPDANATLSVNDRASAEDCLKRMLRHCFTQEFPPVKMNTRRNPLGPANSPWVYSMRAAREAAARFFYWVLDGEHDEPLKLWFGLNPESYDIRPPFSEFMEDLSAKQFLTTEMQERWRFVVGY